MRAFESNGHWTQALLFATPSAEVNDSFAEAPRTRWRRTEAPILRTRWSTRRHDRLIGPMRCCWCDMIHGRSLVWVPARARRQQVRYAYMMWQKRKRRDGTRPRAERIGRPKAPEFSGVDNAREAPHAARAPPRARARPGRAGGGRRAAAACHNAHTAHRPPPALRPLPAHPLTPPPAQGSTRLPPPQASPWVPSPFASGVRRWPSPPSRPWARPPSPPMRRS